MPYRVAADGSSGDEVGARAWIAQAVADARKEPDRRARFSKLADVARSLDASSKFDVLLACVEDMPALRRQRDRAAYDDGSALYAIATTLYRERLRLGEPEVCALLRAASHDCGHRADVSPPIELALRHARRHGLSPELASAVRAYRANLRGLPSTRANTAKRKASFLTVLARDEAAPPCWSDGLAERVRELEIGERLAMERAILHMALNEARVIPAAWASKARSLADTLGTSALLSFLERVWPSTAVTVPLETAGSHVLKNFVWLLEVVADDGPAERARADALVIALTDVAWSPPARAAKIVAVAAGYLAMRPPAVALEPVRRLEAWAQALEDGARAQPLTPRITVVRRALESGA